MSDHIVRSSISAIHLKGPGIIHIPPQAQITVMDDLSEPDVPDGMTVVLWQKHKYAVFLVDLKSKAMQSA